MSALDEQEIGDASFVAASAGQTFSVPVAALFPIFFVLLLPIYWPSLEGPWFADDFSNIAYNDYIQEFTRENLAALIDPRGAPANFTQNYAPVHLLAHALEWQMFGEAFLGYHVVNLALHALASTLLVALLLGTGVPRLGALLGGLFFLLHPANVEAVAWMYQLKTTLALVFLLTALRLRERAPAAACLAFVLGLLTKALAAVALPVAILLAWCRPVSSATPEAKRAWAWLGVWTLAVLLLALYGFPIFSSTNAPIPPLDSDPLVLARTIVSIAGRYLAMAATGASVGAFAEVPVATSALDPWWLGSLAALLLLGWRAIVVLLRRQPEVAWWTFAAASFVPISQIFPFIQPIGDRYLYLILPGLIGGVLLAGRPLAARRGVTLSICIITVLLLGSFGLRSYQRALLWRQPLLLNQDAIERFPDGLLANNIRAERAAAAGDVDAAVLALQKTLDRGDIRFRPLVSEPQWQRLHGDPRVAEIIREMARRWVEVSHRFESPGQVELRGFAEAHAILGDYAEAEALLERALAVGGKRDAAVRAQLEALRAEQERAERARAERARAERARAQPEEAAR